MSQYTRDFHEFLSAQCDNYLKISGGNAHLAFDRRDIRDLSKLGKEKHQMVHSDLQEHSV